MSRVVRLARIVLRSSDPPTLAPFYRDALGFSIDATEVDVDLRLGATTITLVGSPANAARYPVDVPGWSPRFQHCALRVADMDAAYARLCASRDWRPISRDGPERLPAASGGVRAFKFRDPEGHPLELLDTGDAATSRLDHSAISVVDVARSIAYYEALGLTVRARSFNTGLEQTRLDDVGDARVDVVALGVAGTEPHIELLGYRDIERPALPVVGIDDIAATRFVFELDDFHAFDAGATSRLLRDPDGHLIELVVSASAR